jgi:DNA-binding MarR family transcriptional regulator
MMHFQPGDIRGQRLSRVLAYIASGQTELTNRQLALLMVVCWTPGPHHVRTLAAWLGVGKPIISRSITTLSRLGFMRRVRDEEDKRNVFAVATQAGREFLEGMAT